jgi:hypothetical protein
VVALNADQTPSGISWTLMLSVVVMEV